jgi:sugar phosphate permease
LGSSVGQLVIGYTQEAWGYLYGFWLVVSIDVSLALIPITILLFKEIKEYKKIKKGL